MGWLQDDTPYPMIVVLLALSALALGTIVVRRTVLGNLTVPTSKEEAAAVWPA